MDPLSWFQQNVINKIPKGTSVPKSGGSIVPINSGQLLSPTGIQQITTNLRVPGGSAVPGGGIGMLGAKGQNFGIIDKPMDRFAGEVIRGGMTVLGMDTKDFSKHLDGKPVVRNMGGTSFNISTPEGQRGYKKAIESGKKPSTPTSTPTPEVKPTIKDTGNGETDPMKIWAEKYKNTLAPKVKPGQAGYDKIQDVLGTSTQDERDAASDRMVMGGNAKESMAAAKGADIEVVIDGMGPETVRVKPQAQAFKDNAQMSLINTLNNGNITPIVEGINLPDTSKYGGIFNQTESTDYKTMMENAAMGQLAENLGLPTKGYDTSNYFGRMFGK